MHDGISICPAIRRLELSRVGPWNRLRLVFSPRLNIITGPCGSGKSTIIASALACLHPLDTWPYRLAPAGGNKRGAIRLAPMYPDIEIGLPLPDPALELRADSESRGMFQPRRMSACLERLPRTMALILDDEATGVFDQHNFRRAAALLNKARCQVIAVISSRYERKLFPAARVFACSRGNKGKGATCRRHP
jgi:ABC-type iron transport system FetAB ATPase subunit